MAQKPTPSSGSSDWLRGVAPQRILADLLSAGSCYSARLQRKSN